MNIVLMLPGLAFAGAFLILGHAIATRSLLGAFGDLLAAAVWLVPWGILAGCLVLLLLILGGMSDRFRWLAALCVATLAICSTVVVLALSSGRTPISLGQLMFFAPAFVSASVGLWLAVTELQR